MAFCIGDAPDYIGGKPTAGYILCVDAGGRWTQKSPTDAVPGSFLTGVLSLSGLKIESVFSTETGKLGFFLKAPIAQQALLAARDVAVVSNSLTGMDVVASHIAATNLAVNSLNLFLRNYGLQSTG